MHPRLHSKPLTTEPSSWPHVIDKAVKIEIVELLVLKAEVCDPQA